MRTAHHARRSIPPRSAFAGFRYPSDVIVLGASEARARGAFFPLRAAAAFALVSADLEAGLESLWAELERHVAGRLHDDVALLLIERSS